MSWKLIDRPKTLKVTKTLAKQFCEMEPAPHDRPLSERRLQVYQKLMNQGQFEKEIDQTTLGFRAGVSMGAGYAMAFAVFYGLRVIASAIVRGVTINRTKQEII